MIKDIFYLPQNRGIAFLVCIAYVLIFAKFYGIFLERKIINKLEFLNNRDKQVMFTVFLMGFISLLLLLLIKIIGFRIHYFWWTMGILTLFGGALGLAPFSFIERKNRESHRHQKKQ
ncbi:MAG: hypothetical protein V1869_06760 [Candidatus Omnitrophota bacterium]